MAKGVGASDWQTGHTAKKGLIVTTTLSVTVLVENTANQRGLLAEHGLAFWVECNGQRFLFDTGQGMALARNAAKLGIDLSAADVVILSHGHYDHGGGMGALAGLVASAAHIAFWAETERELIFFLYNVDNWLVPAGYLLSGALFGYVRDSQRERLDALKREKDGRDSELKLAKAMYTEANEDRSRLLEQVLRYRDSYGRIYRITCELDAMLPQQIFLSALGIVEEMMQCRSVAIYARSGDLPFARLAVSSREAEPLPRSLDLGRMPALRNALDRGELFANTDLKPGYPAFASPIRDGEEMLAMIALWDVPFDRQTLYYENLLNVVSGLVQSALRRAVRYFNLSGDMYLEDTRILTDRAFRMALDVYQAVRKRQSGDFLLARLRGAWPMSAEEIDRRTGGAIRSVDLIGRLSDGEYYALFPQATAEEMPLIDRRLAAEGLRLEDVSREMAHV